MKKIAIYSSHAFEEPYLDDANKNSYQLIYISEPLSSNNVSLCSGCAGIAIFTSDEVSADILSRLKIEGIQFIVTRSTGYDHIDIKKATALGITVANVPGYSPNAIAEHAVALILALSRHLIRSNENVNRYDFSINELIGFNLDGKTVGIVGTGKIGEVVCKILNGFGCQLVAFDIKENKGLVEKYGLKYVTMEALCHLSDIITLHAPLNESTQYLVNKTSIQNMKDGVMLINTSRGKLINTADVLEALDNGKISCLGTDVYEKEKGIFFNDYSKKGIDDQVLKSLINNKNVLLTSHHAFLTKEALKNIADTTMFNISCFTNHSENPNQLT
ncbi:MAG: 2-hydroxyacid dehydrogenase [Ferruginibacter sp.]